MVTSVLAMTQLNNQPLFELIGHIYLGAAILFFSPPSILVLNVVV